jgi:putative ABC transport system permease protein
VKGMPAFGLALKLSRREMRTGLRGFGIFLTCLFLGVSVVAGVGTLSEAIRAGLKQDARSLLGGDVEVRLTHRSLDPETVRHLQERSQGYSEVIEMRAMARPAEGGDSFLVEIKGVDDAYPMAGRVVTDPPLRLKNGLERRQGISGAVVEETVLAGQGLNRGDRLRIGDELFEIRAVLRSEPDRTAQLFTLGPRVLVERDALLRSGLVAPGSLVRYAYRVTLPDGIDPGAYIEDLEQRFPAAGWRTQSTANVSPRISYFLDRMGTNLTLVGLAALLVGGLGILAGVRGYLQGKIRSIAIMKCMGGTGRLISSIYLLQVLALAGAAVGAGLLLGSLVPLAASRFAEGVLPLPVRPGFYPGPLVLAGLFGLLTTLLFSAGALARAGEIPPALLFRGEQGMEPTDGWRRPGAVTAILGLLLVLLAVLSSPDRRSAFWFTSGAVICAMLFRVLALGFVRIMGRVPRIGRAGFRLGLASISRPGSTAPLTVFSLGLGLTVLITILLVQQSLMDRVAEDIPREAPAFFAMDIQPDQLPQFMEIARSSPGVERVEAMPQIRGRITAIAGVEVGRADIDPEVSWAVRSDRSLTYAQEPPPGSKVVSGNWWPKDYQGPPLISLTKDLAEGFRVGVGDTLTLNILGREVTATIASLREVEWSTLALQFAVIFSPGLLESAPGTYIATVYVGGAEEGRVYRLITRAFPAVSVIRISEVIDKVTTVLLRIGNVFSGMSLLILAMGFLVLAGTLAADQHRRIYEAVVCKVLGGTRRDILLALTVEFAATGLLAGLLSAVLGSAAALAVTTGLMGVPFSPHPGLVLLAVGGGVLFSVILGLVGTSRALTRPPAVFLRNE